MTVEANLLLPKFPLADWIDAHPEARHNLALSGMKGELRTVERLLRSTPTATEEDVRALIASLHGVDPIRVFLTHGATEGNAVVLGALYRRLKRELGRAPRARALYPEYPPLFDAARFVGFRVVGPDAPADLLLLSEPNNPTGQRRGADAAGSANNFLMILLGSTPMAWSCRGQTETFHFVSQS